MRIPGAIVQKHWIAYLGLIFSSVFLLAASPVHASAGNNGIKIYEIAGAGGLAGANYRQDTIILFNPTSSAITCSTCAIQTHSGTNNTAAWTVYKLPTFTLPAGGYYMIAASAPALSSYGDLAPIPYDYRLKTIEKTLLDSDNILSSTVGVVALTNTQTALAASSSSQCGTGSQLVDMVGYGSDIATNASTSATPASCYAGSGYAYYDGSSSFGRQIGITRKNKCIDTFDNTNDFVNIGLSYANSTTTPTPCSDGTQLSAVISANPVNPGVLENVTVKATVSGSVSGTFAVLHLDSVYFSGSPLPMYDDGSNGDVQAKDGIFTLATPIPSSTAPGFTYPINVTVSDASGNSYTGSTRLSIANGSISMTANTTSGTVESGGVLTFPITITGQHGYGGILNITCTGSPNTNSLGVPISTQCVSTPPQLTMGIDGTSTISLAIATGTTKSAGFITQSILLNGIACLSFFVLGIGVWRTKQRIGSLFMSIAVLSILAGACGCGKNAGLGDTGAAPGTYTYTVTATDSNNSSVTNSLTFTVTVK